MDLTLYKFTDNLFNMFEETQDEHIAWLLALELAWFKPADYSLTFAIIEEI